MAVPEGHAHTCIVRSGYTSIDKTIDANPMQPPVVHKSIVVASDDE